MAIIGIATSLLRGVNRSFPLFSRKFFSWTAIILLLFCEQVLANPSGGSVVGGTATITQEGNNLVITQGSKRAIINWQDFSIDADEVTNFLQPDSTSSILNRVISNNPSEIFGNLTANGQVFLINQNGIVVGSSGVIDTNSFIASTLDVSDSAFMSGEELTFLGESDSEIINLGKISAIDGDIYLIARDIKNEGSLTSNNGTVALAAGSEVLIEASGEQKLFIQAGSANGSVENSGLIDAASAEVKAAGGNEYALAINNSGTIRATGTEERDGRIWLVAETGATQNTGTLEATKGDKGGEIQVLGDRVSVKDGAVVNASGLSGGGEILIGGDYQGKNDNVKNADKTYIGSDATINANAFEKGDGGKVIVWADGQTQFNGKISVTGGSENGNGGFVEVSGKENLTYRGQVDASALNGDGGELLLDPKNIIIDDTGGASAASGDNEFLDSAAADVTIAPSDIETLTDAGTAVTLQANNDITVNDSINTNNGGGNGGVLTFQAGRSITVDASITTDEANIFFYVNDDNADGGNRDAGDAAFDNNALINAGAGTVYIYADDDAGANDADITTGAILAGAMVIDHNDATDGGVIDLNSTTLTGALTITADADVDITNTTGTVRVVGDAKLTTAGDVNITGNNTDFEAIGITAVNVNLYDKKAIQLGASGFVSNISGNLVVDVVGPVGNTGELNVTGTTDITTYNGGFGIDESNITLTNAANDFVGNVTITQDGSGLSVSITDENDLDIDGTINYDMSITTGGDLTQTGALVVPQDLLITAVGADSDVILSNASNDFNRIRIPDADDVTIVNGVAGTTYLGLDSYSTLPSIDITGNFDLTSNGTIYQYDYNYDSGTNYSHLLVDGNASFTVTAANSNLFLGPSSPSIIGNQSDIAGTLTIAKSGAGSYTDVFIRNGNASAGAINGLATVGTLDDVVIVYDNAATISLPGMTVGNTLYVKAGAGNIVQTGAISVDSGSAIATFWAQTNKDVTLNNAGNDFNHIKVEQANNVEITDIDAVDLYTYNTDYDYFNIYGNLTVIAGGNITDSGSYEIMVDGLAKFNAGANNITLDTYDNEWGQLQIVAANNVDICYDEHVELQTSSITGTFELDADSAFNITQAVGSAITVGGNTTFRDYGSLTLSNTGNVFGDLYLYTSSGGTTDLQEDDAITQFNNFYLPSQTTKFTVTDDQAITLDNTSNYFGNLQITQENNGEVAPGAVHIAEGYTMTQAGAWTTHGNTYIQTTGDTIDLDNYSTNVFGPLKIVGANLYLYENDTIEDYDAWSTSTTFLNAYAGNVSGQGNIVLDHPGNVMGDLDVNAIDVTITENSTITDYSSGWNTPGTVVLNAASNAITLNDITNVLGDIDIDGTPSSVTIYEDNDITQSGAWAIGAAPVYLNCTNDDIILTQSGNVMGNITIYNNNGTPATVSITEDSTITQGTEWLLAGKPVTLIAENDNTITLTDVDNIFGNLEVTGGAVSIRENDDITDGGAWTTTGTTTLHPGTTGATSIVLNEAGNVLGNIAISGDPDAVTIVENDSITQASAWSLSGDTVELTVADDNDILLTQAANVFGDLNLTAGGTGNVSVTENDDITDGTAWTVGNTATLTAGANNITLDVSGNLGTLHIVSVADASVQSDIDTIQIDSATNATIEDSDGIDFNTSDVTTLLKVEAGGHITQTGGAITAGNLQLIGAGYATLENVGNDVNNLAVGFSGGDLSFVDTDDFAVATIGGTVGIGIGANNVNLQSVNNTITGISDISNLSSSLTIETGTALELPSMIVGGFQDYTAGGAGITLTSGVQSTAAGDITFNSPVTLDTDLTIQTKNATDSDIYFKDTVAGGTNILTVNADNGQITFDAAISGFGLTGDAQAVLNLTAGGAGTLVKSTVGTNGGITVTGPITFQDDVTMADGNSGSVFGGQVTLGKVGGMDLSGYDTIRFSGGVVLADGPSTITTNNSLLTFENANTVDGAFGLTLDSGTSEITGLDHVGTAITSLSVTGDEITVPGAGITINGPISLTSTGGTSTFLNGSVESTAAGAITFNSPVELRASVGVTSDGAVGDNINFESTVDGNYDLTANSGAGITNFKAAVGSGSPLGDATGAAIILQNTGATNFDSTVVTRSGITSSGTGDVIFDNDVTLGNGDTASSFTGEVTLGRLEDPAVEAQFSGYDNITFGGGITLTGGAVEIISNGSTIDFGNTVTGSQNLTLTALSEGAGTVTGLSNIDTNLTELTVVAQTLSLPDGLTINGPMDFTADGGITNNGALETTADTTGTITFNSAVTLATGDNSFTTANSQVDFNSTVTGAKDFAISTGTGAKNFDAALSNIGDGTGAAMTFSGSGAITFSSTVGGNSGILVNNGANVDVNENITLANGDTGSNFGTGDLTVGYNGGTTTISGYDGITFGGAVALTDGAVTVNSNGSALQFSGAVTGNQNLTVNSGAATTTFSGNVGGAIAGDAIGTGTGAAITMSGAGLTRFAGTLNTASGISAAGDAQFDNDVSLANGDTATDISGAVTIGHADGLSFVGYDTITFGDAVTLQSGSTTIESNDSDVTIAGAINGGQALTIDSGTADLDLQSASGGGSAIASVDLDGNNVSVNAITTSGTQDITGSAVTLNGNLTTTNSKVTLTGPVTLGGNTQIDVGDADIEFTSTINGAKTLALNFGSGIATLTGAIGNTADITSLTTDAGGTVALDGGSVKTTGIQTYNGNVVLGADTVLTATTVTTNGTIAATTQGVEALAVTGNAVFAGTIGAGAKDLEYLTVSGTTALNGTTVNTTGVQTYTGATTIDAVGNATTLTGTGITFGSTLRSTTDAEDDLTIADDGATTFSGAVGDNAQRLLSLTVNGGGTTHIDGGAVTTSTSQQYTNAVELGADTAMSGTTATFSNTIKATTQGVEGLAITGNAVFGAEIGNDSKDLEYLTVSGTSAINGSVVTTTGVQTYTGATTVDAAGNATTLTGTGVTFGSTLRSTTDAEDALTIADDGATTFTGAVGDNAKRLVSLTVNGGGTTHIDGASVTTSTTQQYDNAVELGADTAITGSVVTFNSTIKATTQGVEGLAITGNAVLEAAVGSDNKDLEYLTVSGTTAINGAAVTTTGVQTYTGAATINATGNATTLTGTGITFGSTLRSLNDEEDALTVTDDGTTTFTGAVGDGGKRLKNLLVDGGGSIDLDGGAITTSTTQQYDNAISLGGDTTLTGTDITLNNTVNGGQLLDINASSDVVLADVSGGVTPLSALEIDGVTIDMAEAETVGTIDLTAVGGVTVGVGLTTDNASVTITGPVTIDAHLIIDTGAGAGDIVLSGATSTVNGNYDLTLSAGTGDVTLGGVVGGTAELSSIDIAGNNLTLPVINTNPANAQTYNALNNITLNQSRTHSAGVTYTADSDDNGSGDFILLDGVSLNVTNAALNINAADLDMQGSSTIGTGSGKITITAKGDNNLEIGGTDGAGKMVITGAELQRISTSNELEMKTTGAGNISVIGISSDNSNNISGKTTLNASGTGDVSFITTASTFNELSLTSAGGAVNVGVNLNTSDENLTFATAATISGASTLDSNGGDISFNSTLDVDNSLVLTTDGGTLTFSGNVGSNDTLTMNLAGGSVSGLNQLQNTLTGLNINSNSGITLPALSINGPMEFNTGLITTQGDLTGIGITFNNLVTIDGNNFEFNAQTGTLTFANTIGAGANNITLTGDKIEIDDATTGTGAWTLQPYTTTRNIQLGGADNGGAVLDLADDELARLPAAPSSFTFGRSNGTGTLTVSSDQDYAAIPLNLRAGSIAQTGSLAADDPSLLANGGTIVLTNASNEFGAIEISGTPTAVSITDTTEITQDGAWVLGAANLTADASGNNITLEEATNTFGTVALSGADASIIEAASTDLGASTLSNLTVISTDAISTSGTVSVSSKGDFETRKDGGAAITIANNSEIAEISAESRNAADNANAAGNISLSLAESSTLDQISTTGTVTLTGANTKTFTQTGTSTLTANELLLLGAGATHTLSAGTNTFATIAADTGNISVSDSSGVVIGSINGTNGITATGYAGLDITGTVTQTQTVTVAGLAVTASDSVTLTNAANDVDNLAGSVSSGNMSFVDTDGFTIDTVDGVTGVSVSSGNLLVQAGAAVDQNEALSATGLKLTGAVDYTLDNSGNAITTIVANTSTLKFVSDSSYAIGTVDGTNGITTTGNMTLSTGGTVTQSQAISSTGLGLLGTGTHTLTNASNDIDTLAVNAGTVSIRDTDNFVIGTVNTAGATTTGDLTIQVNGELTQSAVLTIGGDLNITTTHNAGNVTLDNTGAGATLIGESLIGGNYDLTATGDAVTQQAGTGLKVAGTTDVSSASVSFGGTGNIFQGAVTTPARSELIAGGVISLGNINEAGDYAVTSVASADTFDAAAIAGNAVTLDNSSNNISGAISITTDAPAINDVGDVQTGINQQVGTTISIAGTASFTAEPSSVGGSGVIALNNVGNSFGAINLSGSTVSVTEDTGNTVIQSADTSTSLTIVSSGTVTQTGPIETPILTVTADGLINLGDVDNDVDTVTLDASSVNGALVNFVDVDGFDIAGVSVDSANVSLTSGGSGNISQSGALTGVTTFTASAGGSLDLDENAINNEITTIGDIQAGTGIAIADSDSDLTVDGDISATTGDVLVVAHGGNLILADTRTIEVTGAGDIYLVAGVGSNFTNNDSTPGTSALVLDTGRFIIWSDNNSQITKGGLTADEYMNRTYAANGPAWADANDAGANRFYYSDQATLTFTAVDKVKTYGDANPALTYEVTGYLAGDNAASSFTGDPTLSTVADANSNVGSYTITITQNTVNPLKGYLVNFVNGGLTVNKADLTVTADDDSKTYDGLAYINGNGVSFSGFVLGEDSGDLGGSLSYAGTSQGAVNAGSYVITPQGYTSGNYNITFTNGALTVNKKGLTVTAADDSKTYDGLAYSGGNGVNYAGFVAGEDNSDLGGSLSYAGSSQGATDAGSYVITPQGYTSSNYDITFANGALTVNKAALTVTADNDAKTYGDTVVFAGSEFTSAGLQNGETIGSVTLASAGAVATAGVAGSPYTITPSAATGGTFDINNYSVTYTNGALTVNKKGLTVTANDDSKTYDGLAYNNGNGVVFNGFVNAEDSGDLGGALGYAGSSQGATDAGSYVITPEGYTSSNYDITFVNGALTVNKRALTVTADDDSKTYGDLIVFNGTEFGSNGLQNGETIGSVTLTSAGAAATAGVAGSPYTITPSAATGGTFDINNYDVTYANGALTVNKKGLTIDAADDSKTYDGLAYSGGNGVTYTGFVNGEDNGDLGGSLSYAGSSQGATDAGSYVITPQGYTSSNYDITFTNGALTVNKAALTVTADNDAKTYGDTVVFAGSEFTSAGLQNGETIGSVTLASAGAVATAGVAGSPYTITPSAATGGTFDINNYSVTYTNGALTVNKKGLTVTANDDSKTYDGLAYNNGNGVVFNGFVNAEDSGDLGGALGYAGSSQGATDAGSYVITPEGYTSSNYDITFVNGALTVNKRALTVTADDDSKTYGDLIVFNGTEFGSNGLQNGETIGSVTLASAGAVATAGVAGSPYTITPSAATGGTFDINNYSVTYTNGALTVNKKGLTIDAADDSKTYDGLAYSGGNGVTYTGFVNGEDNSDLGGSLSYAGSSQGATDAGSYVITPQGYTSSNYDITFTNGALTVNKAALTVTADNDAKTYGDTVVFAGSEFTSAGLQNGETIGSVTLASAGAVATAGVAGSPYTITPSAATGGTFDINNYSVTYTNGALTVNKKGLTVTAADDAKVYNDAAYNGGNGVSYSGFVNGEDNSDLGGSLSYAGSSQGATDAGSYVITPQGYTSDNYDISFIDGALTVSKAVLTYVADAASRDYGDADPALTGSVTGFAGDDTTSDLGGTVSWDSTAVATDDVGSYPILGSGYTSNNYSFVQDGGNNTKLTVNKATLTYYADSISRTYGAPNPTLTGTLGGLKNGETVSEVSTGDLIWLTSVSATTDVGSYAVYGQGLTITDGNYNPVLSQNGANATAFTVNPAALEVIANAETRTYDGTAYSGGNGVTFSGFVNSEDSSDLGGSLAYSGSSQGATNAGSYVITPEGYTSSNYNITFTNGALTVNKAPLTITADNDSKTYDGLAYSGGNGVSFSGFVNGEDSSELGGSLSYSGTSQGATNAGTYAITPDGYTANNYEITFANGALTVNKAALTVTADNESKTYGETVTFAGDEFNSTGLVNSETIGSVTLESSGAAATAGVAGSPYAITPSAATGGTFDINNYDVTYANGALTVNKAALTVTADNGSKIYGETLTFEGDEFASSGLVNGETIGSVSFASSGASGSAGVAQGPYTITPSSATGGTFDAANYDVSYVDGSLTVNKANLTVDANDASKTYDGLAYSGGNGVSFSGFVNGEDSSDLGGAINYTGSSQGAVNVGSYVITPEGYTSENYEITFTSGDLSVNKATLYYLADEVSKIYGDANPEIGGTMTGFVNGETVDVLSGSLSWSTSVETGSDAGSYAITGSGYSSGNYDIVQASGNNTAFTVDQATLYYLSDEVSRDYGDANPVLSGTVIGMKNGDDLNNLISGEMKWLSNAASTDGVGQYSVYGLGLAVVDSNYKSQIAQASANDTKLTVTPATLNYVADAVERQYGNENPEFSGSVTGFKNSETTDVLDGEASWSSEATIVTEQGSYAVNGSGYSSDNYVFEQAASNATALTITATTVDVEGEEVTIVTEAGDWSLVEREDNLVLMNQDNPGLESADEIVQNDMNAEMSFPEESQQRLPGFQVEFEEQVAPAGTESLGGSDNAGFEQSGASDFGAVMASASSFDDEEVSGGEQNIGFGAYYTGDHKDSEQSDYGYINKTKDADLEKVIGGLVKRVRGKEGQEPKANDVKDRNEEGNQAE